MQVSYPWRAIQCLSSSEVSISKSLASFGLEVFCPVYEVIKDRDKSVIHQVPFIRNYLFARFDTDDLALWYDIRGLKGVLRILAGRVNNDEIAQLQYHVGYSDGVLSSEAQSIMRFGRVYDIGDMVKIDQGPFQGSKGVIMTIDKTFSFAGVKIPLLGREVTINQYLAWCELVESSYKSVRSGDPSLGRASTSKRRRKRRSKRKKPSVSFEVMRLS